MKNVLYLFLIFCAACSNVEQKAQEIKSNDSSSVAERQYFQPKLNDLVIEDSALLVAFYGIAQRDPETVTPRFRAVITLPTNLFFSDEADSLIASNDADTVTVSLRDIVYYGSEKNMCVCITSTEIENFTCHPCGAILGIFVLQKNKTGKWDCIGYDHGLRVQGSNGDLTISPTVYKVSDQAWAVDVSQSYFGMGSAMQWEYHLITLDSNFTSLHIEDEGSYFYEDNLGICDSSIENGMACFEYSSKINFVKSDSSGTYYDLIVNTAGTDSDENNDNQHLVDRQRIYRWKNDTYVLIKDVQNKR